MRGWHEEPFLGGSIHFVFHLLHSEMSLPFWTSLMSNDVQECCNTIIWILVGFSHPKNIFMWRLSQKIFAIIFISLNVHVWGSYKGWVVCCFTKSGMNKTLFDEKESKNCLQLKFCSRRRKRDVFWGKKRADEASFFPSIPLFFHFPNFRSTKISKEGGSVHQGVWCWCW